MSKRLAHSLYVLFVLAIVAAMAAGYFAFDGRKPDVSGALPAGCRPAIWPDYSETVIPPNIAPLNFLLTGPCERHYVKIRSANGDAIETWGAGAKVVIPLEPWRQLLAANKGGQLSMDVFVQGKDRRWAAYEPITNTIAQDDIDSHLAYRLMNPRYGFWRNIDIYQRDLTGFEQSAILRNESFGNGCMNCHTFHNNSPAEMALNVRAGSNGQVAGGMVVLRDGEVTGVVNTKTDFNPIPAIYLAWHPSGKVIAFSTNKIVQLYHSVGENREAFDHRSDLALYRLDSNTVTSCAQISKSDRMETYPEWSPDGEYLYFCGAPQLPIKQYKEVRYSLMRVSYDMEQDAWGQVETVVDSKDTGLSVTHPRISPDGRWLLFCMCERGNFSIWRPDSDLYMMDLSSGDYRRLEINSDRAESWHCWSSNGRWVVFSSKRRDGLFAKPYFSYVDRAGKVHKPILLPQKDPAFYDSFIKTYNVPQFITGPIPVSERVLAEALHSEGRQVKAKLDPKLEGLIPLTPTESQSRYEPGPGG